VITLVKPALEYLPEYIAALKRDWSPDNLRAEAAREQIREIEKNPAAFLASTDDSEAKAAPVILPDGSTVPRLPGFIRWIWDDRFCGSIGFRWQPGTTALPPTCLGHIGYAVVPWKRNRGYAKRALGLLLREIREPGLSHVDLTTDPDNIPSQKVVLANHGILVERFRAEAAYGGKEKLLFRINLPVA
jgi:predicted acetyltransferase